MNKKETAEIKKNFSDKSGFFIMERILSVDEAGEDTLHYEKPAFIREILFDLGSFFFIHRN